MPLDRREFVPERDIPSRCYDSILDRGLIGSVGNKKALQEAFVLDGITDAIVATEESVFSHWWLLGMKDGSRCVYWGNERSFQEFAISGKGHAFEMKRIGLVQ